MKSESGGSGGGAYVRVGKVKDAHGIKGELFIVLFAGEAAWLDKLVNLRLVSDAPGSDAKNFTLKSARLHKNGLIAKTVDLKDRNQAEALRGLILEIPEEFLTSIAGESIFLREIEGFRVYTSANGAVGTVTGFGSNGVQDLLVVKTDRGEFEIPFVDAFVTRLDFNTREIHLHLPEGLMGEFDDNDGDVSDGMRGGSGKKVPR